VGRVAVIGAGYGGLSAAVRLSAAGHQVDLYEKQDFAGGKAGNLLLDGYRFDTGPSLLTMLPVFRELFDSVGEDFDARVKTVPLDPLCTYFYPDGTVLKSHSDQDQFQREIHSKLGGDRMELSAFLNYSRKIYDTAAWLFLRNSLHDPGTYANPRALWSILNLFKIDPFRTMDRANRSFFSDPRLVQLFDRYATYNGSSPFSSPATFNIIPHVEYALGGYAVEGGIYAISKALEKLALDKGVRLHLSTGVERILTENGRIKGILVGGEKLEYDVVVSNADVLYTYDNLLNNSTMPWRRRYSKQEPSSSGLVFYWGIDRRFPELGAHNIFFSSDYKREFSQIFQKRMLPDEPTVYINITSKISSTDAPRGGENWFVLINVPHNSGQDWQTEALQVRRFILKRVNEILGDDVEGHIRVEKIMTPLDIEQNTNSTFGSLYGTSSNSIFAAFRRHPNRVRNPRGLYFCGGSSHPGGGMPLAVLSGKIAADLVRKYEQV
jgi:phytoene desaturase